MNLIYIINAYELNTKDILNDDHNENDNKFDS